MYPIKYDARFVQQAIKTKARQWCEANILTKDTVFLVLMNGGVWFAAHLFDCLDEIENEVYFAKCHSYDGAHQGTLVWDYLPEVNLQGRQVVVLDDICDSGQTATAVVRYLQTMTPNVSVMTLLSRTTTRLPEDIPLYSCIVDDSADFFVGCGLDDNSRSRMLPYIGVIS